MTRSRLTAALALLITIGAGCAAFSRGPTPLDPTITAMARGAGTMACLLVPAADRPQGRIVLSQLQAGLSVDPAAVLRQLETQANTTPATAYLWSALHAVLDPLATAAAWYSNYLPAVHGAVSGCLTTLGGPVVLTSSESLQRAQVALATGTEVTDFTRWRAALDVVDQQCGMRPVQSPNYAAREAPDGQPGITWATSERGGLTLWLRGDAAQLACVRDAVAAVGVI